MDVDIRFLPNQDPGEILAQIRAIADVEIVKCFTRAAGDRLARATRTCRALRDAVAPARSRARR